MSLRLKSRGELTLFGGVADRARTLQRIGPSIARGMREGDGGVREQFRRQGTLSGRGNLTPWKRSERALREGGPTLIDTDDYRQTWLGRGLGSVTAVRRRGRGLSVAVGIDSSNDPRVLVFQAERQRGPVAPRPVSTNAAMLRVAGEKGMAYLLRGER